GGALVEWSCPSRNHIGAYTRHAIRRSWVAPTRRIMTNPGLKSVPIKAVTYYAFAGDAHKALAAGYNGHVSRAYRPRDPLGKSFPIWRKSSKVVCACCGPKLLQRDVTAGTQKPARCSPLGQFPIPRHHQLTTGEKGGVTRR